MEPESHKAGLLRHINQLRIDYQGQLLPSRRHCTVTDTAEMYPDPSQPIIYEDPPTPLEALRMINRSRPAIIRGLSYRYHRTDNLLT
jgi:hypothetical protein